MAARPKHGHGDPIHSTIDTFGLVAETRKQAGKITESARDAIKNFYREPVQLADFIERHETPVYVLPNELLGRFALWVLGYEQGFIPPSDGKRYELLQKILKSDNLRTTQGEKTGCRFEYGVFVVTRPLFTVGFLSHQLHHWLAFRSGMSGYSERAQSLYKRFWSKQKGVLGREIQNMTYEEMADLKAAINRDLEAMVFLREIATEILIPAKQAQRMPQGKTLG